MYKVHFDGGLKQNSISYGYVLLKDNKEIDKGSFVLKHRDYTSNMAEYFGLITALNAAQKLGITDLEVYGDSQLVIYQLNGKYSVKDLKLSILYQVTKIMMGTFKNIKLEWIPRENNEIADRMTR